MYFIFYFLIVILILLFILVQIFNILSTSNPQVYKRNFNLVLFIIVISTLIAVVINIYTIIKNHKKTGTMGKRGIDGAQGNSGKGGKCDLKCGQKVCYINVVESANKKLKELYGDGDIEIKNKYFLKKINKICNSNDYFAMLTKKHKKKPTEKKLINFIKNIISNWIILITNEGKYETGKRFLTNKNIKFNYLDEQILVEMEKYDIYRWGNDTINIKRDKYIVISDKLEHPVPDQSRLYIIKSNNYEPVYSAKKKTDIWDVKHCPYNQLGTNFENPQKLDKCIYIDKNSYKKSYHNTWKHTEFFKPQELSLYNALPYKNKNGQEFYPVGSVWRGKNSYDKPYKAFNTPESNTLCGDGHGTGKNLQHTNKGPEKETILVSGDVKDPISYELIWDSKVKCSECQVNHVQIFKPNPPKNYVALGDVAIKYNNKYKSNDAYTTKDINDKLQIKCVPKETVRKLKLGNRIWNNKNFYYNKYSNYLNYTSKVPIQSNRQLGVSLWDAGNSNSGEEIRNNYGVELEENGGYNLFRSSNDYKIKPELDTYILKQKYLMFGQGKSPPKIPFNLGEIKNNIGANIGANTDPRYTTDDYFGEKSPKMAIITNIKEPTNDSGDSLNILNNANKPKKYYLVDDGNKRGTWYGGKKHSGLEVDTTKPDTYFIKTFNQEKNDFSSCLSYDIDKRSVKVEDACSMNSSYNKWVVKIEPPDTKNICIVPENAETKKYKLVNYYDKHGNNINELKDLDEIFNWRYDTPTNESFTSNTLN